LHVTTLGLWIGTCTTTCCYPALKPACGLAAAVECTTAPKRQYIGSFPELACRQSAGGPHHCTTTPPAATLVTFTFAISAHSHSSNSAGLPLHADTSSKQQGATLTPGRLPLQRAVMTTQAPPRGAPFVDLRVASWQAPLHQEHYDHWWVLPP